MKICVWNESSISCHFGAYTLTWSLLCLCFKCWLCALLSLVFKYVLCVVNCELCVYGWVLSKGELLSLGTNNKVPYLSIYWLQHSQQYYSALMLPCSSLAATPELQRMLIHTSAAPTGVVLSWGAHETPVWTFWSSRRSISIKHRVDILIISKIFVRQDKKHTSWTY